MNGVGIDVSYKEVVIVISVDGKIHKAKTFDNNLSGHILNATEMHFH